MLEDLREITKKKVALLKRAGIDTIEKLAAKKVEELLEIKGITRSIALAYIIEANDFLTSGESEIIGKIPNNNDISEKNVDKLKKGSSKKKLDKQTESKKIIQKKDPIKTDSIKQKPKEDLVIGYIKDIFPEEIIQRIRFLHFKLKKLELSLEKQNEIASYEDLDLANEYIDLLNINYKIKNQNLVIKELAITPSYYDPIDNKEFDIFDLMFECARVSWVSARLCSQFSKNFEKLEDWENAIISMVRSSKMYKTATYYSAAAVNQDEIGKSLEPKNLEFESEQSRIFAQSLAAIKEERQNNLILASKLYAGLSLLSRRLLYLGFDDEKIKKQLIAQADFDMGKACYLKAQNLQDLLSESSDEQTHTRLIEDLLKKAVYYFSKSEEIWEDTLKKFKDLAEKEKGNILFNLSVVDDYIKGIDAEIFPYEDLKNIKNPEPYIAVPENLAEKLPRTTLYFSNIKPMDINVEIFKKYSKKNLDKPNPKRKKEELLSKKTSLGRTIKELRSLYDNNDVDIDKYTELYEKYTTKLNNIELEIQKLEGSNNQDLKNKK